MHFDQEYNDNQHQCPEKLVCSKVRLHGSHWQKAHHCFHMDTLKRQRYHLILQALEKQRNQVSSRMLFHFISGNLIWHVMQCEQGLAFHTKNSAPPTVCILDLGCTRAMGSRRAVEAFCSYVGSHPNSGLWHEIQPTSSRFFFANSQQSKCTEKLVLSMHWHGNGWNTQFTEFDIVEEDAVPLLMSLPQKSNSPQRRLTCPVRVLA